MSLMPWDTFGYFYIRDTNVPLTGATPAVELCKQDTNRVVVMFSITDTLEHFWWGFKSDLATKNGFYWDGSHLPLTISNNTHGVLSQLSIWAVSDMVMKVHVVEVLLNKDPCPKVSV